LSVIKVVQICVLENRTIKLVFLLYSKLSFALVTYIKSWALKVIIVKFSDRTVHPFTKASDQICFRSHVSNSPAVEYLMVLYITNYVF
jgi:hypothetical protein